MNWDEKNLDSVIEFINRELRNGRSLADIERNEFGVSPSTISKRLSRRNYKRIDNKFIKLDRRHFSRHDVISIEKVDVLENNSNKIMTVDDVVTEKDNQEKLINIINRYDDLMKLLDNKITNNFRSGIVIELPNEEGKKDTRATVRINKVIWERFNKFCDDNKAFSKKELLSQALKEFIEKYE
ncbi:hypothetical protein [Clostridium sp.]|uniref:hypothetical protein n=1 Tax=Clostridium sp. TaxID=1506 RepID=UPI002FC79D6E